jgi:myo-inositol 2-dehydrogenase / D-chiro-inositol 1-dehydrogenase
LTHPISSEASSNRRDFLTTSTALAGASLLLPGLAPQVHAAGGETLRIGLIGCGGRGGGAAAQALRADPNLKLVAMGDAFPDRLKSCLDDLGGDKELAKKVDVKQDHCFVGFDAYKQVINSGVDVVLLCTPPHFRAAHLKAAVEAGKHIFAEKPVAVDVPGVRSVMESCREAKKKNLAVVSGLCYRYERGKRETMKRIHDGSIGEIITLHTNYNAGGLWSRPRQKGWSDMEWQMRNWLYFTWLSGDHIVEQHIHSLDKMMWAMKDVPPLKANGTGGRQVRTGPEYGHIFDHHAVVFEWANGVKLFAFCRQQNGTKLDVNDYVYGAQGHCDVMKHTISGKTGPWRYMKDGADDMYQNEHNELFASIRSGQAINNGDYMCQSTLMAIMGRMATYTGQTITWDMVMSSQEDLTPARYEFGDLPVAPVPMPGKTKYL